MTAPTLPRLFDAIRDLSWMDQALCVGEDPELFHPVGATGPTRSAYQRQVAAAKAICAKCPVQATCDAYAVQEGLDGIWGGRTENERRVRRRQAERPIRLRDCNRCGAPFWTTRGRYCSDPCRSEAARAARAGRGGAAQPQPSPDHHLDTVRAMAAAGHSDGDISTATGLSHGRVEWLRRREHIPAGRPPGWPRKELQTA